MNELHQWWAGRGAKVWVAALAVVLVVQFVQGFWVGRNPGLRNFERPEVPKAAEVTTFSVIEPIMVAWFPKAEAETKVEKTLVLQGVIGTAAARKAVIAVSSAEGAFETRRVLSVGDEVEGWKVSKIDRSSAELMRGGEQKVLRMFPTRPGVAP